MQKRDRFATVEERGGDGYDGHQGVYFKLSTCHQLALFCDECLFILLGDCFYFSGDHSLSCDVVGGPMLFLHLEKA